MTLDTQTAALCCVIRASACTVSEVRAGINIYSRLLPSFSKRRAANTFKHATGYDCQWLSHHRPQRPFLPTDSQFQTPRRTIMTEIPKYEARGPEDVQHDAQILIDSFICPVELPEARPAPGLTHAFLSPPERRGFRLRYSIRAGLQ